MATMRSRIATPPRRLHRRAPRAWFCGWGAREGHAIIHDDVFDDDDGDDDGGGDDDDDDDATTMRDRVARDDDGDARASGETRSRWW